jgi:hypothetical protein
MFSFITGARAGITFLSSGPLAVRQRDLGAAAPPGMSVERTTSAINIPEKILDRIYEKLQLPYERGF